MPTARITWIDSVSAGVTNHKIYRDDVLLANLGLGIQTYDDTTAVLDQTYKYEVQALNADGESTDETIGVNVQNITISSAPVYDPDTQAHFDNLGGEMRTYAKDSWNQLILDFKAALGGNLTRIKSLSSALPYLPATTTNLFDFLYDAKTGVKSQAFNGGVTLPSPDETSRQNNVFFSHLGIHYNEDGKTKFSLNPSTDLTLDDSSFFSSTSMQSTMRAGNTWGNIVLADQLIYLSHFNAAGDTLIAMGSNSQKFQFNSTQIDGSAFTIIANAHSNIDRTVFYQDVEFASSVVPNTGTYPIACFANDNN
jgi:hypothetical protein